MNSIAFVRDARALLSRMSGTNVLPDGDTKNQRRKQHQQDFDYLCNNMTNPSLPTAHRLVHTARRQQYTVDSRIVSRVNQF